MSNWQVEMENRCANCGQWYTIEVEPPYQWDGFDDTLCWREECHDQESTSDEAVCDVCGHDSHTERQLADCLASALGEDDE